MLRMKVLACARAVFYKRLRFCEPSEQPRCRLQSRYSRLRSKIPQRQQAWRQAPILKNTTKARLRSGFLPWSNCTFKHNACKKAVYTANCTVKRNGKKAKELRLSSAKNAVACAINNCRKVRRIALVTATVKTVPVNAWQSVVSQQNFCQGRLI